MQYNDQQNILLHKIQMLCKKRSVRLTPQRLEIFRLISEQNKSISAYHLLNLLHKSSPKAKPSTIYRALNFLLSQGVIHRITSTNTFMLCHHFSENSHEYIVFICNQCKQVTEKINNNVEKILRHIANITGFKITYNIIETHGICKKCIAKK